MGSPCIYLVPLTHMDLFWLGEREECLSRGSRAISAALALMREYPDFRFLLEDMVFVDYYLACHPEQTEELRAQAQAGRMEVGAKWAGIYQQFFPGETLVRNLIYGKQFVRDHFGLDPDTVHLGDIPGYTPQYVQILAKGGVRGLVICRGGPGDQVLFHWQAPNGSEVLVWNALRGYHWSWYMGLHRSVDEALTGGIRRDRSYPPLDDDARQIMALTPAPIMMHWGIDLVSPPQRLIANVREWNERTELPMRFATTREYFDAVANVPGVPTLTGEITSVWPTVAEWRPDIWFLSSPANYALIEGEAWAELARRIGFPPYERQAVRDAWKLALQGMDHNWDGTATQAGNRRHREYLLSALIAGEELRRKATHQIAEAVTLPDVKDITPLIVFNSASWARSELVTAHASFYGEVESFYGRTLEFGDLFRHVRLYDHAGQEVPFQYLHQATAVTREATICFMARDVPAFGYRLYYLAPAAADADAGPCCQVHGLTNSATVVVESDRFRLEIERSCGSAIIYDKVLGRTVTAGTELVGDDVGDEHEDAKTGRIFHNCVRKIDLAENGTVRARLVIEGSIGPHQTQQEWIIGQDLEFIEVVDHVVWAAHPSGIFIKRVVPTGLDAPTITYGTPFGTNTWEGLMANTGPHLGTEPPVEVVHRYRQPLHWIDASDAHGGVTVATERRAVEREGTTLRIAILHADPQRHPSVVSWGDHRFAARTRLRSHSGDWQSARSFRDGSALLMPLFAVEVADPLSPKRLPPVDSLCDSGADNVILTTIKRAEANDGTIVRGFEVIGQTTWATPRLAGKTARPCEVDLMEENPTEVADEVVWQPYEIKTFMMEK